MPGEKNLLSYLHVVLSVDIFLKTGSVIPLLVAARSAKASIYRIRLIGLVRTFFKNNLSAHGCVAKRFKMLTYYVYAPLFHRFTPCPEH
jgi:hypothetical protein